MPAKIYGRYNIGHLGIRLYHGVSDEPFFYEPRNGSRAVSGLVYIREGEAVVRETLSGRTFGIAPGDLILIPMKVPHTITWHDGPRTHDIINFIFNYECTLQGPDRGRSTWDTIRMSRQDVLPSFLPSDRITRIPMDAAGDRIVTILADLWEAYRSTDEYTAFMVNAHFYHLIGCVHDALYPSGGEPSGNAIDQARLYLDTHCTEELSVAELAARYSMDRSYFSRSFKRIVGMPPVEYKNKARMELAKDLLRGSDRPVSQIAELLGYGSEAHFRACFREYTGLAPLAFRKNVQNEGRPR